MDSPVSATPKTMSLAEFIAHSEENRLIEDVLTGGAVLPDFELALRELSA